MEYWDFEPMSNMKQSGIYAAETIKSPLYLRINLFSRKFAFQQKNYLNQSDSKLLLIRNDNIKRPISVFNNHTNLSYSAFLLFIVACDVAIKAYEHIENLRYDSEWLLSLLFLRRKYLFL